MLRSPIIVTLGHVDHGKTTLLDKIRGTAVTKLEPGMISQHVGASFIPLETVKKICEKLIEKFRIEVQIPGLLFLDTPGHAAFITLRKRGGAVSDLAILVVDITEGFQEQTDESLNILKEFKTPFLVAATKIDKIPGWYCFESSCFLDSFKRQSEDVKDELDKKVYVLVSQLAERGFNSERFDRIEDFRKQVAIVPCSGITGEGIPELLMVLTGLAQQFLRERLQLSNTALGTVLEVKETVGFGTTIDVILYDGKISKGDYIIIGGKEPLVTRVRALLKPRPLQELRVEKQFESVDDVCAAAGIKIAAPNLENVVAGSPIIAVKSEEEIEKAKEKVQAEVEEIQFIKNFDGVVVKADTLGTLEALIKLLGERGVPIRKAEVGNVSKQDVVEADGVKDKVRRAILAFNVNVLEEARNMARDLKIDIFQGNVIYRIVEDYEKWVSEFKEREIQEKLEKVTRPCEVIILKGCIFRSSNPAIFGVEVKRGLLKPGILMKKDGKIVGRVKEIQSHGQTIQEARKGDKVAISMEEPVVGRHINEGDVLISFISEDELKILREVFNRLSEDEREMLNLY
ncbi:MAG: translation initiation factor IF-2 [Candidatus Aenigmatarchaeota archaeon]